jgi:sugar lactone lactonase YvrE
MTGTPLKLNGILITAILVTAGFACRKSRQYDEPSGMHNVFVTTIAGTGTDGLLDGPALFARFKLPADVIIGQEGTIYVTDLFNSRIREIRDDQVTTFAGNNTGLDIENGKGTGALFIDPRGITIDRNGNLYITDGADTRIRKITRDAAVTTYAGIKAPGFLDAKAAEAQFMKNIWGIAADIAGNVFVADAGNNRIRKIDVSGDVTTVAGGAFAGYRDGKASEALFARTAGIAVDKQGNLYVLDAGNQRIRKITPAGIVSTLAGSGVTGDADGSPERAQFREMFDIVVDSNNNLFVTDNHRIRKISSDGTVTTIAGSGPGFQDGTGVTARFNFPSGLAIDTSDNLYVCDTYNSRIRKIRLR